jgi:hypothetical protein
MNVMDAKTYVLIKLMFDMYVSTILTQIKTAPNDTLLLLELEVSE